MAGPLPNQLRPVARSTPRQQALRLPAPQLLAVRALYLQLAWLGPQGPWAAPMPVSEPDVKYRHDDRRHKSRMRTRTRVRLSVLSVLATSAAEHYARAAEVLAPASQVRRGIPDYRALR